MEKEKAYYNIIPINQGKHLKYTKEKLNTKDNNPNKEPIQKKIGF